MWKARCIYTHEIPCQDPRFIWLNRLNHHVTGSFGSNHEPFEPPCRAKDRAMFRPKAWVDPITFLVI